MSNLDQLDEGQAFQELLDSLDPESRLFFAEADLGRAAKDFLGTELGRYLVGCAQQEYKGALTKLKTTPWWRRRRIQQLQNEAWRAENFLMWLGDLVVRGRAAEHSLTEREEV